MVLNAPLKQEVSGQVRGGSASSEQFFPGALERLLDPQYRADAGIDVACLNLLQSPRVQVALLGQLFLGEFEAIPLPAQISAESSELWLAFFVAWHTSLSRIAFSIATPHRALHGI